MIEQVHKNNSLSPHDTLRREGLSAVGRELREAREALGISVAEMANALRIRSVHIESLEDGLFDDLPGRPYTLGFARSIAGHLGLEPDSIAMRLRDEVTGAAAPVELIFPESTEDKRLSRAGWIAISLALVTVAYGAWLALSPRRDVGPPEFAAVKSNPVSPSAASSSEIEPPGDITIDGKAPEATVVETPPASAPPAPAAPVVATKPPPAPVSAKPDAPPAPVVATPAAPVKPTPTPTPSPPAAVTNRPPSPPPVTSNSPAPVAAVATASPSDDNADDEEDMTPEPSTLTAAPSAAQAGHVTLRARQDSLVQIQSSDGVTVMARTLRAGDSYAVPDRPGLRLTTGNAGALDVMVDGQNVPAIGQIGTVRRNVSLDPAQLKAGMAIE